MGPPEHFGGPDIRVVIVDDSAVVRRLVSEVVQRQQGMVLAGTADNGREALRVVERAHPDVVVLDVEMPVMDGLHALGELKRRWPKLAVVMFSTLTERGAAVTLEALARGADDYLTKPTGVGGPAGAFQALERSLVPLLRAWGAISRRPLRSPAPSPPAGTPAGGSAGAFHVPAPSLARGAPPPAKPVPTRRPALARTRVEAVVMGCSTGGPNALGVVVPSIPADIGVPVLVVQHMPPTFTKLLAQRLDGLSPLVVQEVEAGMPVQAGHLYIARGGSHMAVARSQRQVVIALDDGPPENSCKPSVDVLFRSAAATWGAGVLGVVLTGMGQDGRAGSDVITSAGGTVVAQDEASSVVWGMPGAVVRQGLASEVLPLSDVAATITRYVHPPHGILAGKGLATTGDGGSR
ncbi:MAG TPA: chemotaxis response regulator protein-glutamate methylesterase [Acidimicrobiales bacterium]|nr:chemotaxis response regulator protein-glutamate methylesterase [Acidimicrobiales bacterium]